MVKTAVLSAGLVLGTAHAAFAASYAETGDAGDLVTGAAQLVTGTSGASISSITGTLSLTAGISEADAYKIYISSPSTFSASTTAFVPGSNSFDSQLFLFSLAGVGIVANDDTPAGTGSGSSITAGNSFTASLAPGYYYLLIAGSSMNPTSAAGLIFPSFTDGTTDPTGLYGATTTSPITGYAGSSNEGGAYSIALTGVTIFAAAAVPEPSTVCLGLAGGLMLLGLSRRRAGKTSVQ